MSTVGKSFPTELWVRSKTGPVIGCGLCARNSVSFQGDFLKVALKVSDCTRYTEMFYRSDECGNHLGILCLYETGLHYPLMSARPLSLVLWVRRHTLENHRLLL